MGRSVSTPSNCNEVAYKDVSWMGYNFDESNEEYDYSTFDSDLAEFEWDDFVFDIKEQIQGTWSSFEEVENKWLGREDKVLLENTFAYVGVSNYCGLAAIWLKSKHDELDGSYYCDEQRIANLSDAFCNKIKGKFYKMFSQYRKIATFSNGEAVYEKVGGSS
jgi:hypothetical protein